MKRIICVLILVCLMPFGSLARGEGVYYAAEEYIQGLWAMEGETYVLDGQRVVRLTAEGGEVQTELKARYAAGAYDGKDLWCARFDEEEEALMLERIDSEGGAAQSLAFDAWDVEGWDIQGFLATEQGFCLITQEGETVVCRPGEEDAVLVDVDEDGYDFYPRAIAPWGEESVLLAGEDGSEIWFYILNLTTGRAERGPAMSCMDVKSLGCLMTAEERVVFVLDGKLWQMEGLEVRPQQLEDANINVYYGSWGLLTEGVAILAGRYEAESLELGKTAEKGALKVQVGIGNERVERIVRQLEREGLDVELSYNVMNYGDASSAILTGSDAYDVYIMSTSYPDYNALYKKGYLLPLEDEEIALWAEGVYPGMARAFTRDGVPVALPVVFDACAMAYNPKALKELGIKEIPTTWKEFFRFLAQLSRTGTGDFYTFSPDEMDIRGAVFSEFFQYAMLEVQQLEDPRGFFDTQEMRETLAEFEKIDFDAFEQGWEEMDEPVTVLFYTLCNMDCSAYWFYASDVEETLAAMPLSLMQGEPGLLDGRMDMAFINPYAQNPQGALQLLKALLTDMPEAMRASMQVGWTTPIEDPYQPEEPENGEIQYLISPQDLARYQEYAGDVRVRLDNGLGFDGDEMLSNLVDRYLTGNLSGPEFLRELDEKFSMMMLERE